MSTLLIIIIAAYVLGLVFNAIYLWYLVRHEEATFDDMIDYVFGVVFVAISFVFWLIVLAAILEKQISRLWKRIRKR